VVVVARPFVLDLAAHVHALIEEGFPDALERIEARPSIAICWRIVAPAPFFWSSSASLRGKKLCGRFRSAEGHPFFVTSET